MTSENSLSPREKNLADVLRSMKEYRFGMLNMAEENGKRVVDDLPTEETTEAGIVGPDTTLGDETVSDTSGYESISADEPICGTVSPVQEGVNNIRDLKVYWELKAMEDDARARVAEILRRAA